MVAALLCFQSQDLGAQTVESVDPSVGLQPILLPRPEDAVARTQTQIVWNDDTGRLERRKYVFWDPLAGSDLDFFWDPRRPGLDKPGAIEGEGVLTWRVAGSLRYGESSIIAQYRGSMSEGRFQGNGTFVHRSRLRYDGDWVDGAPHGQGHLVLPDGDVYAGGFRAGVLHGFGRYISASGAVYEGGHLEGERHGAGLMSEANRFTYASLWMNGRELPERRSPAPEGWPRPALAQAQASEPADLAVTVSIGGPAQFCCTFGPASLSYTSTSQPDGLEIFPDDPEMLATWRGERNIVVSHPAAFDWDRALAEEYNFLNYSTLHIQPVTLLVGLENRGREPVRVVAAFLEVDRSKADLQPALQSLVAKPLDAQNIDFSIENYGWTPAEGATLRFEFVNKDKGLRSPPQEVTIGQVSDVREFSFVDNLKGLGVQVEELPGIARSCDGLPCVDKLVAGGVFGRLGTLVSGDEGGFGTQIEGRLRYHWQDADGKQRQTDSPFDAWLPLGSFNSGGECEGADFNRAEMLKPFDFVLDNPGSYRIPMPLSGEVEAGVLKRWRIGLQSQKSSENKFKVVFQLADGRLTRSREVDFLYFKPRSYPESIRPFQPRC